MGRVTVDFGIDLGTTNSAVGFLRGDDVEIIRNNEGYEYTPSAVHIDRNGSLVVGRGARERLEGDPQNTFAEFKLQMGTDVQYSFARSARRMLPEELSAEVLKSLKADVRQRLGEDISAAVITVPAAFELPQCQATYKAAQLADIDFSPLVQEPIAAAMAYGYHHISSEKVFWLVYDLGGGTFDAAVMQVHEGVIQVVNHGGDNQLGGKLMDWAIVEQQLIPALTAERRLTDFRRGNPKWVKAIAKLKQAAEHAKIRASRDRSASINIDSLCLDDNGDAVDFEYDLMKSDVERLAEPFILRSINICRKVLSERGLGVDNLQKVILVGGPTLMPYLRERLADSREGLGIPLDYSVDPLTVVARGAAIFAGTQRDERATPTAGAAGAYAVELDYKPIGAEAEVRVGGRVVGPGGEGFAGHTLEFINETAKNGWRSGPIPVGDGGGFVTRLWAEEGHPNTFSLILRDAAGRDLPVAPDKLDYSFGVVIDNTPLIHSVGIALANNEVRTFFEKGTPLPARKRFVQKLAYRVAKGQEGEMIRVPVVEGEHRRADRNTLIGYLQIPATEIQHELPAGTEIEITVEIDQSRLVRAEAFIALLNENYETELKMGKRIADPAELASEVEFEKRRLEEIRERAYVAGADKVSPLLEKIEEEQMVEEVEGSLGAASVDPDAADKCENRLRDLKAAVDDVENALAIPLLAAEAEDVLEWAEKVVRKLGEPADRRKFEQMKRELLAALSAKVVNQVELARKVEQMDSLRVRVEMARDEWWLQYFAQLEEARDRMTNGPLADQLLAQGRRAINSNDIQGVQSACRQLVQLLPASQQQTVGRFKSTII